MLLVAIDEIAVHRHAALQLIRRLKPPVARNRQSAVKALLVAVAAAPERIGKHRNRRHHDLVGDHLGAAAGVFVVPAAGDKPRMGVALRVPCAGAPVGGDGGKFERIERLDIIAAAVERRFRLGFGEFRRRNPPPAHRNGIVAELAALELAGNPADHRPAVGDDTIHYRLHPFFRNLLLGQTRLVGTEMDHWHHIRRDERTKLVDKIAELFADSLVAHRFVTECAAEGERMAGHVEFRHHGDAALCGIIDNFLEFRLRIELADIAQIERLFALELRILFRLQAPAVIFGQMPMEKVHPVRRHLV